ncbi:MAG: zinc-finger domain-containing protein [Kordiimonadaceae bacterium]|nr:zinc-finger domain-containing protein [Kordiimonadaceae bacterium]
MTANAPETKIVDTRKVACNGDDDVLGHPRVYLTIGENGETICPYCDKHFILQGGPADTAK